jgi:hypothetical protein
MRSKKSTYSNSHIQEEKKDESENISDNYTENIADKHEQLEKEDNDNTVMNTETSLTTLSEQSPINDPPINDPPINDLTNLEIQDIEGRY